MENAPFEEIVEAVGVGVCAYGDDGRYTYVNPAYAAMLETAVETLVGTPIWELNSDIEASRFEEYWDSFQPGETRTAEAVHEYDGTAVEVQTITTSETVGGEQYHFGTIQDITLRKRREEQLSQLHEVTGELIQATTAEEIASIVVRTAETILGYDRNVVRFVKKSGELSPVAATAQASTEVAMDRGYGIDEETPGANAYRSGEPVLVDDADRIDDEYSRGAARSILYLPIGEFGVFSIADTEPGSFGSRDVDLASILISNAETALARLENECDLERQNERLEAFVDVISHDIPNHLNVAESRLELARMDEDFSHLDHVSTAHGRIESLITDMRALVDHGRQIESTEWLRLQDEIRLCWESCPDTEDGPTLLVDAEGFICADRSRFRQLLENLLWNALEYAGEAPTIRIGLLDDGIYIEDDGPGIDEETREEVLSPGFTTADDDEDHYGFGLAIVNEIVRAHGWEIAITEGTDGGARFEITGVKLRAQ
ncbi:MAG: ATP-binding protein [Halovenus sp.]